MTANPEISQGQITGELEALESGQKFSVKFNENLHSRLHIRETDRKILIEINPKRIRTQAEIDHVMGSCRRSLLWGR